MRAYAPRALRMPEIPWYPAGSPGISTMIAGDLDDDRRGHLEGSPGISTMIDGDIYRDLDDDRGDI